MRGLRSPAMAALLLGAGVASAQGPTSSPPTPAGSEATGAPVTASPATATPTAPAETTPAAPGATPAFDVENLFASTCGWCHSDGGRAAGRGPKLMDSPLTDAEMAYRIKAGKQGAMPAFGSSFNDEQIKAIVQYARNLKPAGSAPN